MIPHTQRREHCALFPAIVLIAMQVLLTKGHDKDEVKILCSVEKGTIDLLGDQFCCRQNTLFMCGFLTCSVQHP